MFWIRASTHTSLKKDLLESAFSSSLVASLLPIIMKKSYWKRSPPNVLLGSTHCPHLPPPSTYSINCRMYRRVCSIQRYDRLDKTLRRFHFFIATVLPFCRLFFLIQQSFMEFGVRTVILFLFPPHHSFLK